jgi:acetate---CoA ligase (ADP-forming)
MLVFRLVTAPASAPRAIRPLVDPRSLVLIGASPRRPAPVLGAQRGAIPVWAVNPGRNDVLGAPSHATIFNLPEVAETAVLLVGHERIEQALAEAIKAGVRSFIVPGLGNESGAHAAPVLERLMRQIAAASATMLGPNCMGVAVPDGASPWLAPLPDSFRSGHVAAIVQSGSIGEALVALGPRIGFRAIVSCGAEADIGIADLLDFFATDERTRAVALFVETVRRPAAFAAALERCAELTKPVVCLKVGSSQAAARAALAHTGAMVGSRRAFSALLRRTGALQVDDLPELVETLEVLGRRHWPRGTRVVAVSESGGEAALLADRGADCGLQFNPLPAIVREAVMREFPALTAPQNPLDAWAADLPERIFSRALQILAADGNPDVLLAQVDLSRFRSASDQDWNREVVQALGRIAGEHGLFAAVTTVHTTDPPDWAYDLARTLDIALLRGARDATAAIARIATWSPHLPSEPAWGDPIAIEDLLVRDGALPEHESCSILERYGVPFAPRGRAQSPQQAAEIAQRLGAPVVVKRDGPAHKARGGGVRLSIDTPENAALAAAQLGGAVVVARQVSAGAELFCGAVRDPHYGSVIALGAGGSHIEDNATVTAILGPLSRQDAARMVSKTGFADPHGALALASEAVSRLMHEHPEVTEVDINPLICNESETIAVDALVVVASS